MLLIELIKMTSYKSEQIIFIKFIYFSLTIIHKYIEFSDLKINRKKKQLCIFRVHKFSNNINNFVY